MTLKLSGIHHLKIPVADLESSAAWFGKVLGAERLSRFDHKDDEKLFAVILRIPGVDILVELRHAPKAAAAVVGYDPITFAVEDEAAWRKLRAHFDEVGVQHSEIIKGFLGYVMEFKTPDGLEVRLYTHPVGGFDKVQFQTEGVEVHNPSLDQGIMKA